MPNKGMGNRRIDNELETFDLLGRQADRIVTILAAPARQSDAASNSGPLVPTPNPDRDHGANHENDRVKQDERHLHQPLPSPLLMQAALEAILRPRRNKPPWPPVTARQKPKSQA